MLNVTLDKNETVRERILAFLDKNYNHAYNSHEIAQSTDIDQVTVYEICKTLSTQGIIQTERKQNESGGITIRYYYAGQKLTKEKGTDVYE